MSGLSQETPISAQQLNYNIDADIVLNPTHGLTTGYIKVKGTGGYSIYGTTPPFIHADCDGSSFSIYGGNRDGAWAAALPEIFFLGINNTNVYGNAPVMFLCPNAAKNNQKIVMYYCGVTNTPTLNLNANRIENLADPTAAQDAATKNYVDGKFTAWADWAPTLTWGTATPGGLYTATRWMQIGKTVFYSIAISATDGNNASSLTISLPVTAGSATFVTTTTGRQKVDTTHTAIFPYIQTSATVIAFVGWATWTDTKACALQISGFYEVD
jgi:hypothetical protein